MEDKQGKEIKIGSYVRLLEVQSHWFEYEPKESYEMLQKAYKSAVEVSDVYDGKVVVDLPRTKDHDGEFIGNSISTTPDKVEVVSC